jgi:hypothetical protein
MDVMAMDMSFISDPSSVACTVRYTPSRPVSMSLKRHLGLTKEYAALSPCELDIPFYFISHPCALSVSDSK